MFNTSNQAGRITQVCDWSNSVTRLLSSPTTVMATDSKMVTSYPNKNCNLITMNLSN